jgi:CDP-6-deoxy-D-xylo-4-hexulose-3-dehydrase
LSIPKFPLATETWNQAEYDALQRVIASGMFTMGSEVQKFEGMFASYVGSKYCVMVNSGSSANLLMVGALRYSQNPALQIKPGDEVIVPAVSWSTTYYPLHQYGLKLKFVDIDIDTLNYDLNALSAAVGERTRAIVAVNLLGNPNDFSRIQEIIDNRNIILLEDNCESLGAELHGRKTGTFGIMGSFSSFFSHHISTMEGGMVVTDDEEMYHLLLSLRAHGWTRNLPKHNRVCGTKSDNAFDEAFRFVLPGYNVRPLEMSGAVGVEQLKKLPSIIDARQENAKFFKSMVSEISWVRTQKEIGKSSWFGFSLIIDPSSKVTRQKLIQALNDFGVEYRPIVAGNFAKNEVMRWFDFEIFGALRNADILDKNGLFVGNHHYPLISEFDVLHEALISVNHGH